MEKPQPYVSCIKINGVPILPPLITSVRRKELLEYKNRALYLEEIYLNRRSLRKKSFSNEEKTKETNSESNGKTTLPSNDQSFSLNQILKEMRYPSKYVPYENGKSKVVNLSTDLIDVSEYSSSNVDCIIPTEDDVHDLSTSAVELDLDKSYSWELENVQEKIEIANASTEIIDENLTDSSSESKDDERPRLIRSNSYTLDNPSPLLIAHLKRQNSVSLSNDQAVSSMQPEEVESIRAEMSNSSEDQHYSRTSVDTEKENISGCPLDINYLNIPETSPPIALVLTENQDLQRNSFSQPTVEVITTDITVQQINITTSIDDNLKEKDLMELLYENKKNYSVEEKTENYSNSDPEAELKVILQQIPENYSKKILELIEKQKLEQQKRIENYENIKQALLNSDDFPNNNGVNVQVAHPNKIFVTSALNPQHEQSILAPLNTFQNIIRKPRSNSESAASNIDNVQRFRTSSVADSQSVHLNMSTSCSESLEDFSVRTVKMVDLEREDAIDYLAVYEKMYPVSLRQSSRDVIETNDEENSNYIRSYVAEEMNLQRIKEYRAASIICAYVKGYLVRRLMKTTKVQTFIQTIQDALLCALDLQGSETIEEADVELHRRLIQQVSAACYEFHDVFFALTIAEQMDIIAIDREKKKKALTIRNTRSTVDFHPKKRSTSNVRLSKSLTKV